MKKVPKHIVKGICTECGAAMSVDVIRADQFQCRKGHVHGVADIIADITLKLANRARYHAELPPLPGKSDKSGFKRPKGEIGKLTTNKARVVVDKLGKSEALRHAGKLLESAVNGGNQAQIEYQQGLIAEIEAL